MKTEFRIREVTRYVVTRHDSQGTHAIVQVDNLESARQLLAALECQAERVVHDGTDSINSLGLLNRTLNTLRDLNVVTIDDLRLIRSSDILAKEKTGPKTLDDIQRAMRPYGGIDQ